MSIDYKNMRIGETNINNQGLECMIIDYRGNHDIDVKFKSGYIARSVSYNNFIRGSVSDKMHPSFLGVGYMGDGKFTSKINDRRTIAYQKWRAMLSRCYGNKKPKTYENCTVCDEWLNFQNFAQWIEDNYYTIEGERIELDKDILVKGNKIYSPNTCLLIPKKLNDIILNRTNDRSSVCLGVRKHGDKYIAYCNREGFSPYIGIYDTKEEAFAIYKKYKLDEIIRVANIYKDIIPLKVYNAIISYDIQITD